MTSSAPEPEAPDESTVAVTREEVVIRRSPRYWRIIALGAGLGALAAFILTFALPKTESYSQGQVFGFLLLLGVVIFGALAALLALLLDRLVGRKTATLTAERTSTERKRDSEG